MQYPERFDVIVVGGGHAGAEAALAAARAGCRTMLLTHNLETLGQMSCNPAVGGIGKSHIVREVDALGGLMARATDRAGIQFRRLNASKGPAVRALRAQADRALYKRAVRGVLEHTPGLVLFQGAVADLVIRGEQVRGVVTDLGLIVPAPAVVLTVGTFLGGRIHVGAHRHAAGRAGDPPANALAARLREYGFGVGRLKTGTPPRLDGRSIDFGLLEAQPGERPAPCFSFLGEAGEHPPQVPCHLAATNPRTHDIIRAALHRSPLYGGAIEGAGPRYCPSIEDKVVRFADKTSHAVFIEPEGLGTTEVYPNGISTSLPFDVQWAMVRSMRGFAQARLTRPGYAIEYDYFDPRELGPGLQTRAVGGLFFAGQINGTTGYEEAAGQGLVAGINAALLVRERAPWQPRRDQAYIGVLLDDLVTRGVSEPYRMFTSRAEYRLSLREDNADLRLTERGRALGLVDDERWRRFEQKREAIARETQRLRDTWVRPGAPGAARAAQVLGRALPRETRALALLGRPGVGYRALMTVPGIGPGAASPEVAEQVEIEARYSGYIGRQQEEIEKLRRHEQSALPQDMDYGAVAGLSTEAVEKLSAHCPATIGQAARIAGVTPVAVSLLLVHLKKRAPRAAA